MGLDFSAASMVVFVELPQEVALVRQAEDRAHRHGQRNPVNVYFLMAKGTCDERRWVFCHWYCRRQSMALGTGCNGQGCTCFCSFRRQAQRRSLHCVVQ